MRKLKRVSKEESSSDFDDVFDVNFTPQLIKKKPG